GRAVAEASDLAAALRRRRDAGGLALRPDRSVPPGDRTLPPRAPGGPRDPAPEVFGARQDGAAAGAAGREAHAPAPRFLRRDAVPRGGRHGVSRHARTGPAARRPSVPARRFRRDPRHADRRLLRRRGRARYLPLTWRRRERAPRRK